ncbi:sulfurtransferase complex subunit TusB [Vibrio sp. E150_018]
MLHIIKSQSGLADAINVIQPDDAILLIEDAVYALFRQSSLLTGLKDQKDRCWVLQEDLGARGLVGLASVSAQLTDFKGFVYLSEQHSQSITWD